MKLQLTAKEVKHSTLINHNAKLWCAENWEYLTKTNTPLINVNSSTKIEKGKKLNIATAILYLQPADLVATETLCAGADLFGCKEGCLISSGQLGMLQGKNASTKRTVLYLLEQERFMRVLGAEIEMHSANHGDTLAVRLNGTSDIDFSSFIQSKPHIQFYDYTKIYYRMKSNKLPNYDLTFSGSANGDKVLKITARAIRNGFRTVLAMNTAESKGEYKVPSKLDLIPLVNMDETDVRFKDASDAVGVLKRKGSNKAERARDELQDGFFFNQSNFNKLAELVSN